MRRACARLRALPLFLAAAAGWMLAAGPVLAVDLTLGNNQNQTEPVTITENSTIQTQTGGTESAIQSGAVTFSSPFILTLRPVDSGDQLAVTGVISGGGSLNIAGAGTTILSGNNTFTGGVTVTGTGKVRAVSSNAFGTGTVTIDNSTAVLEFGDSVEIANAFVLNTNSTFSTLTFNTEEALLNGTVALGSNTLSLVAVGPSDVLSLTGVISGTGALTVSGTGIVSLSGANTFSGGITITEGTSLGADSSGAFGTGTVTINHADAILGFNVGVNVANNVVLLTNAEFTKIGNIGGTGQLSGNVNLNANVLSLTAINPSERLLLSGVISGTGSVTVDGAGTVILSGANTYTGGTTVESGGNLQMNGSIVGQTAVNSLGTLSGTGTAGSVTVDGRIAPGLNGGTSIGTLSTTGNVTFNSGSSLAVNLAPDGSSDLLNVGGTTSINSGATINATLALTSFTVGQTYTVLDSTGAISGSFGSVVSNFNFLGLTIIQAGSTIQVQIASINALATVTDATSLAGAVSAANAAASGSAVLFAPASIVNLTANAPAYNLGANDSLFILG
ncbi:MAG TPA: autotransporter-associated beta strand repeat-containing protein, partial [Sphingomonadales bacterium]|nr:autotransporter-associated beta strand repeat-containing protein [Sphingomonadales bacterium]